MTRVRLHHVRSALLTLGAVLGVACVLSVAAGLLLDVRPLVVQSGSMSPTIETGALAWARQVPASDLEVGDVVMVENSEGNRVTHRIITIERHDETATLELQGDANDIPDVERYPVQDAYRVFADIPYGGRVVAWLSGPFGLFLLGMYAMGLLLVLLRPARDDQGPPSPKGGKRKAATRRGRRTGRTTRVSVGAGTALLVALGLAPPSWATFTDAGAVSGPTLSTGSLVSPTLTCTENAGAQVTISWTAASAPAAHSYTALVVESNQGLTVNSSGTTRSVVVTAAFLSTLFGQTVTVRVTPNLAGTSWTGTPATTKVTVLLLGLDVTCGSAPQSHAPPSCVRNANGSITLTWTNVSSSFEYYWERREAGLTTLGAATTGFPSSGTLGASVAQGQPVNLTLTSAANGTANWDLVVWSQAEGTTSPRGGPTTNQIGRHGSDGLFCTYQN